MKKKAIIISSIVASLLAIGIFVGNAIYSWYVASNINTIPESAYTDKYGYCERYCEYDYEEAAPLATIGTFNADAVSTNINATIAPGDVYYYCVMFDVLASELSSNKTYNITLNIEAQATLNASAENGDYAAFLADCVIEANECLLFSYTRAVASNSYYSFTEGASASIISTAIDGLAIGENTFKITIPAGSYSGFTDSDNINHSVFMLYVPIWYQDTNVNQNEQMCSQLTITKTKISV